MSLRLSAPSAHSAPPSARPHTVASFHRVAAALEARGISPLVGGHGRLLLSRRVLGLSLLLLFLLSCPVPSRYTTRCRANRRSLPGITRHRTDERSSRCS